MRARARSVERRYPASRVVVAGLAVVVLMSGGAGVHAGTRAAPEVLDRSGDANHASDLAGVVPGVVPSTGPASLEWADITRAWISTDYYLVDAVRKGVRGKQKVPYGFSVNVELAGPPEPVVTNASYEVRWRWNNCSYSAIAHIPGAIPDSKRALLFEDCAAGGLVHHLAAPAVDGDVVTIHVPFGVDRMFAYLYPGASLAEIHAFSGHYVDGGWPPAYRSTARRTGVIDYAPSTGRLGAFVLGSDLDPMFIPDPGER